MEKKEVRTDNPVKIVGATLIPVVEVSLNYWHDKKGIAFFGIKQPVRVVVVTPSVKKAFMVSGEEVSLNQLIQEMPDIKAILEEI